MQERTEWVLQHPAQLVLIISQIYWCNGVEKCFASADPTAALTAYLKVNVSQLAGLTRLVRGSFSSDIIRQSLSALITLDVHARDIVDTLLRYVLVSWTLSPYHSWVNPFNFFGVTKGYAMLYAKSMLLRWMMNQTRILSRF